MLSAFCSQRAYCIHLYLIQEGLQLVLVRFRLQQLDRDVMHVIQARLVHGAKSPCSAAAQSEQAAAMHHVVYG